MHSDQRALGSFKDPSGFIFQQGSQLFRRINRSYLDIYHQVRESGLFQELIQKGLLIEHEEVLKHEEGEDPHIIIKPRMIRFISYPYEWSFSALKDAALATLEIQSIAISKGFTLKDAHGFNILFDGGRPILIDSLSFDRWDHTPWLAYRQFCESFLVPLALMRYRSQHMNKLLASFLNGIPIQTGSVLLPFRTRLSIPLLMHIHMHARQIGDINMENAPQASKSSQAFSKNSMLGLCMSLQKAIRSITPPKTEPVGNICGREVQISPEALFQIKQFAESILREQHHSVVWDLECRSGDFSKIAAKYSDLVVSLSENPMNIERLYQHCQTNQVGNVLPLQMNLVNPSAAVGWELEERQSLFERGECDLALAFSLLPCLCISSNIPMDYAARFFSRISKRAVIEFVPKSDPLVQLLLSSREDIFTNYDRKTFESSFAQHFRINRIEQITNSGRMLYYMERK